MSAHLPERFWAKVNFDGPIQPHMNTPCWVWTASTVAGYGQFWTGSKPMMRAHRYAWTISNGPIPDGMVICHACDNRLCVRVDHLFLGTVRDNNVDAARKQSGRWKGQCKRGHDMSVYGIPANKGRSRRCGKCQKELRHA